MTHGTLYVTESMGAPSGATTRLDLMKNLVELLLVYTSFADFVSIVPFGKVVEPLISDQLVAASKPTKAHLLNSIRFLEAGGNSKLSDGFKTAFSILKNSAAVGHTSECQKVDISATAPQAALHIVDFKCLMQSLVIVLSR